MCNRGRTAGLSLLEVVVFIVVLGVGFAGMLVLYNRVTTASVDPVVRKQTLAIAQSLLEEIELRAYTYCDPDDANVYTASSAAGCATLVENIGPEAGETRYNNPRYDNVNDYNGFCMGPGSPVCPSGVITTAANVAIPQLADYRVDVSVAQTTAADNLGPVPLAAGLHITVTAKHVPTGTTVSLEGYRVRYAPNSP
jgi:MSHA pilin protein MshD